MSPRAPGVRVFRVLLGAALVGSLSGVALALASEEEPAPRRAPPVFALPPPSTGVAAPRAPSPGALNGLPPFLDVAPRPLITAGRLGPMPLDVAWFETDWGLTDVLRYYQEMFRLSRRAVVTRRLSKRSGYVAWLETDLRGEPGRGVLHMVSALEEHGRTLVFLSANDPLAFVQGVSSGAVPADVPLPPTSTRPTVLRHQDEGLVTSTISLTVPLAPTQALEFFRQRLGADGWAVQAKTDEPFLTLSAERGRVQQAVLVAEATGGAQVTISHEERP